jgi:serine/threonine protein kinase
MLEISRTVQSAHEHHKVFHGDLKPANIIVNDAGEVTIIDWDTMSISAGVQAELIGTEVTVVETSGTPHYMPAEQFKGEKVSVTVAKASGAKYFLVEQDNAPTFDDPFEQVERSIKYITNEL